MASNRTIGRLSLYRRLLKEVAGREDGYIFSHELAMLAGCTAAQVRRDVMAIGYTGSPARGYDIQGLIDSISRFLDPGEAVKIVLVGVGNLGRALLSYFGGRGPQFNIVAAFDSDPEKTNRVIHGCRCYPLDELSAVAKAEGIHEAIVAVPANAAQDVAARIVEAGVRGIVNFAPVRLWVPEGIYVENVDVTMTLERVVYFARQNNRVRMKA